MAAATCRNAAENITLEDAQRLYEQHNVCVIIDEGRHVTLADEDCSLSDAS